MEEAMAQSQTSFAAGQIVKGTVIEIRQKEVMIDIGYKSEGSVPVSYTHLTLPTICSV